MKKNIGFTLLELLVTIVVLGIVVLIASVPLLDFLARNKVKHNTIAVKQFLQEAQNYAKARSTEISVFFTDSQMTIETASGAQLNSLSFEENIKYDASSSGLTSDRLIYNFKGSPIITSDAEPEDFQTDNGKITICYFGGDGDCNFSNTLFVNPLTGVVTTD